MFSGVTHGLKSVIGSCFNPGFQEESQENDLAPAIGPITRRVDSPSGSCSRQQAQAISLDESRCWFCGGVDHIRSVCPARNTSCSFCSRKGHFCSVCERMDRLSENPTVSSAAFEGNLSSAVIPVQLNGFTLIDTGSTASYIDSAVADKLCLQRIPHILNSVVNCDSATQIKELKVGDFCHNDFKLGILPGLCCDVLLGHDLFSKHGNLIVKFGGKEDDFVFDQVSSKTPLPRALCNVAKAEIDPPPLFHTTRKDSRPIACK